MGPFNLAGNFRAWIDARVDNKMKAGADAGQAAARAAANVKTGRMRSLISATYRQDTRTIDLHGDAFYTVFQNNGFVTRSGRAVPGRHFMEHGVAAIARVWGGSIAVNFPNTPAQYHGTHPPRVVHPNAESARMAIRGKVPLRPKSRRGTRVR